MALDSSIGLLFRIKADGDQAIKEVKRVRESVTRETKELETQGVHSFQAFGQSIDIPIAGMSKMIPVAGAVVLGVLAIGKAALTVGKELFELSKEAAEYGSKIHDAGIKTGLTSETLSGLDLQLTQSGTNMETFTKSVFNMQKNLEAMADGGEKGRASLAKIGLTPEGLAETEATLRQVLKTLAAIPNESERNALGAKIMGKSYQELAVFVADTGGDIDAVIEKARKLNLVWSQDATSAADRLGDKLDELDARFTGLTRSVGSGMTPVFIALLDQLDTGFEHASTVTGTATALIAFHMQKYVIEPLMVANVFLERFIRQYDSIGSLVARDVRRSLDLTSAGRGATSPTISARDTDGSGKDTARQDAINALKRDEKEIADTLREARETAVREYEAYGNSLRGALEKIEQAERDAFEKRKANLEQQRALVKTAGERKAIDDEIKDAEKARDRAIEEARRDTGQKEVAALKAHLNNLQALYDDATRRMSDALREQADNRVISFESAETRIKQIQEDNFNQQLNRLKEQQQEIMRAAGFEFDDTGSPIEGTGDIALLNTQALQKAIDEFNKLTSLKQTAQEQADRDIRAARARDLENEKEYYRLLSEAREEHRDKEVAAQRERLNRIVANTNETKTARMAALVELVNMDLRELEQAYKHHLNMLDIREREAKSHADTEQKKAEIEAQFLALRQQALDAFEQSRRDRVSAAEGEGKEVSGGGFLDGLFGTLGEGATQGVHDMTEALNVLGQTAGQVFGGLASGIGGLIQNWALLGTVGPGAARKMLAAILAQAAGIAAVEAIMETARGIKETAAAAASAAVFDYHGAALHSAAAAAHFNAAIVFGLIAGGAAIGARAIAPASGAGGAGASAASFGGGSRGASASGDPEDREPNIIERDRNRFAAELPIIGELRRASDALYRAAEAVQETPARVSVDLDIKPSDAYTVELLHKNFDNAFFQNFRRGGHTRDILYRAVNQGI